MKELKIGSKIICIHEDGTLFFKGKELRYTDNCNGYLTVFICSKRYYAHRLVLIAYSGFDLSDKDVNHINGIKSDNRIENLEWCTRSENITHAYRVLKRRHAKPQLGKGGKLHHRSKAVVQLDIVIGNEIKRWGSIREAASYLGIRHGNIINAIVGRQGCKQSAGYKWEYVN